MTSSTIPAISPAPPAQQGPARYTRRSLWIAALLSAGAAAIHFAVIPDHLAEYLPFGLFFILLGLAQVGLAVATVLRPDRRLFAVAAGGTLAAILLWAVSRTVGLPIGPEAGEPEAIGWADLATVALEGVAVVLFALLARGPRPARPRRHTAWRRMRTRLAALGTGLAGLLIAVLTTVGVLAGASGMPADVNMAPTADGSAVSIATLTAPPGTEPVRNFTLTAQVVQMGGQEAWTYNGAVPGPELRVTQGDRVRVTLVNQLKVPTTIHWHGVDVPNAEDGVAGLTQDAVPPGGSYTYEFIAKDAGTYWYHSHQDPLQQITRGLYGALIVEPQTRSAAARDYAVALGHVIDTNGQDRIAVNGHTGDLHLDAQPGEQVRLRLINAYSTGMSSIPVSLVLLGAPYTVAALDGRDLNAPGTLGPVLLPIGSGQRYDLVFQMPASGQVRLVDSRLVEKGQQAANRDESVTLGSGAPPATPDLATLPTFDLTAYGAPAADPLVGQTAFDVSQDIRFTTQAGFRNGTLELIHLLNGVSSPNVPPIVMQPGQVVRLRFINETDEYHPMHLHGHTFTVLSKNGHPLAGSPVHLDTLSVGPRETWEVAFRADNPGIWMLHCHAPIHANYGMSIVVEYAGYTTPYRMGTRSGNIPE